MSLVGYTHEPYWLRLYLASLIFGFAYIGFAMSVSSSSQITSTPSPRDNPAASEAVTAGLPCAENSAGDLPGKLIVFEGGDGVGKTTQLQRTAAWLTAVMTSLGRPPLCVTREPGGTLLGQQLRQVLLHRAEVPLGDRAELLLYGADRAQHVTETLRPALAAGRVVLCDRYTDSTVAYQGYGRQLDRDLIDQVNQLATGGLVPDLTLWLDADVACTWERRQRRAQSTAPTMAPTIAPTMAPAAAPSAQPSPVPSSPPDRMEQADRAFHERVRQGFQSLAAAHPERVIQIAATGTVDEVFGQIQRAIGDRWAQWYGQALPVEPCLASLSEPGLNPGLGSDRDPGLDSGLGSDLDPGLGSDLNQGLGSNLDPGLDPGLGSGLGSDLDPGLDPGLGSDLDPGLGSDLDPGLGSDLDPMQREEE
jgi:dTMP kinase